MIKNNNFDHNLHSIFKNLLRSKNMVSRIISQDILKYLINEGYSINKLSEILSISKGHLKLILNKNDSFTPEEIKKITKELNFKIIELLSLSCHSSHLSEKLRKNVNFYKKIKGVKKDN
jgi:ribosome biogenesis GTPase A